MFHSTTSPFTTRPIGGYANELCTHLSVVARVLDPGNIYVYLMFDGCPTFMVLQVDIVYDGDLFEYFAFRTASLLS